MEHTDVWLLWGKKEHYGHAPVTVEFEASDGDFPRDDGVHSGASVPHHEEELCVGEELRQVAGAFHRKRVLIAEPLRRLTMSHNNLWKRGRKNRLIEPESRHFQINAQDAFVRIRLFNGLYWNKCFKLNVTIQFKSKDSTYVCINFTEQTQFQLIKWIPENHGNQLAGRNFKYYGTEIKNWCVKLKSAKKNRTIEEQNRLTKQVLRWKNWLHEKKSVCGRGGSLKVEKSNQIWNYSC